MNNNPNIYLKEIITRIRPPRYATFIDVNSSEWKKECLNVIEWYSLHWGGLYNIIIPTDRDRLDEVFWNLLEIYKPDFCFNYIHDKKMNADSVLKNDLVKDIYKRLNIFKYGSRMIEPIADKSPSHHLNLDTLIILKDKDGFESKIYDFNYKHNEYVELILRLKYGSTNKLIKEIQNYNINKIINYRDERLIKDLKYNIFYCDEKVTSSIESFFSIREMFYDNDMNSIYSLTYKGLEYFKFFNIKKSSGKKNIYLIFGNSVKDFCLYQSLYKITNNAFWITDDLNNENNFSIFKELIKEHEYEYLLNSDNLKILVTSLSLNEDILKYKLKIFDEKLSKNNNNQFFTNYTIVNDIADEIFNNNPQRLFEKNTLNEFYVEHFYDNESANPLKVPVPSSFQKINTNDYRWYVDIDIMTGSSRKKPKQGYILPSYNIFNKDVFIDINEMYEMVRFTGECISFYCPNLGLVPENLKDFLIRPKIQLLESFEIFKRIFNQMDLNINTSDKGLYTHQSIELFGSLENICKDLLNENIIALFNDFINNKYTGKDRLQNNLKGICLNSDNRVYLNYDEIKIMLQDEQLCRDTIERYLNNNIFKRGFILKCKYCKNSCWYDLVSISQDFICKRCDNKQKILKENWLKINENTYLDEPTIYYKLNEIFFQGYTNDMRYPLLTQNYIKSNTQYSFIFIPEIEIKTKEQIEKNENGNELDIVCISDGELMIGEVKKKAEIPNNLNIYNEICEKLNARFLISTFKDKWSDTQQQKVKEHKWKKEPRFICKSNLTQ